MRTNEERSKTRRKYNLRFVQFEERTKVVSYRHVNNITGPPLIFHPKHIKTLKRYLRIRSLLFVTLIDRTFQEKVVEGAKFEFKWQKLHFKKYSVPGYASVTFLLSSRLPIEPTMKLRLRSSETKETVKLEIPNPCNLQNLRDLISQKLPSPSTLYFSLNQKDMLTTTSPEESIQSVGVTSGDLIYYTTNPNGFNTTPQSPSVAPSAPKAEQSQNPQTCIANTSKQDETSSISSEKVETADCSKSKSEEIDESMEIDDDDGNYVSEVEKSFSVPGFLRKVFTKELGDDDAGLNHKLLGIAVRAVLLESGFVEIDPVSKSLKGNNFNFQGNWYLASFYYTIPDIITSGNIQAVKIKFQHIGKYSKVYGSLVDGTMVHSVLLDEDRLVPFLNVVWANCGQVDESNQATNIQPEKEVFEFWRKIKDGLALPLLIDLCEKAGLQLPSCFMQLPTELKLKILESVSGIDIAKVSCVCSELRYLASNDDLWKQKYIEQFGDVGGSEGGRTFKERFVKTWESRKRRKIIGRSNQFIMRRRFPFGVGPFPRIIGGDYDLSPNRGLFGLPGGAHGPRLRNVMPNCNLGGLDL
ncbi:hypothetical protein QVD17_26693 [Tagetes erecta]|uniref:F-box domain-containing protein n=1 Tax=Tagetes erecta TaxID=13708 RepID=A0AAD8K733_TARER|nr:hypothetical protein QVD17_26693 [Tagetes erecta]